jgi:hypothetical protein
VSQTVARKKVDTVHDETKTAQERGGVQRRPYKEIESQRERQYKTRKKGYRRAKTKKAIERQKQESQRNTEGQKKSKSMEDNIKAKRKTIESQ